MGVKALGAFSGGLDSMLAARTLADQGIEVHLATFFSPFFGSGKGRQAAARLGMPWRELDYTGTIMELVLHPPSGLGRNCNPCIDCHAGMFAMLGRIAGEEGFSLIFSGEVLGQRPMSQNRQSLGRVAFLSGFGDILLRPLSAKLLKPTRPESEGQVDRNRLLDICGRSRKRQMELAAGYSMEYDVPAGGCKLTDVDYSARLRVLLGVPGLYTAPNASLATHGRMFVLPGGAVGLVGRDQRDNEVLVSLAGERATLELADRPGPSGVLLGDESALPVLASLVALYGKTPPGCSARVKIGAREVEVMPMAPEEARIMLVTS
jgi:tRNA-uridine 2-sulfurtransferase